MKHFKVKLSVLVVALCVLVGSSILTMAADDYKVLQVGATDEQVTVYVEGDGNIEEVACQVGMTPCEKVEYATFAEGNMTLHTIVLFDNSLSITQENKEKAIAILKTYVENKNENEYVSIATFGEDIQLVSERTNDTTKLITALESIQHNNQDTYLTDVLYDLLDTLSEEEYTRFIVVSDGVDNKSIGITKEELLTKMETNAHPIYTLGHIYKSNDAQLENMFALSRMTNGSSFLIDDIDNVSVIVDELVAVDKLIRIKAEIPNDVKDGSVKSVLVSLTGNGGVSEVKTEAEMPFSIKEEPTPVVETIIVEKEPVETVVEVVVVATPEPTVAPVEVAEESGIDIVKILALVVVAVAAVVLLILKSKKDKGKSSDKKAGGKNVKKAKTPVAVPVSEKIQESTPYEFDPEVTVMLDRRYMLVLRDAHDPSKIFKYPLDSKVTLGRNVDKVNVAIDYNRTVSGMHCEISVRNSHFYICDLNSANKTYVNGQIVQAETEIHSGCLIALGEVELSVEIIPI